MKSLLGFAALAAATCLATAPAAAQPGGGSRYAQPQDEEGRFDAAQDRFERELAAYQQALQRYRDWRSRNPGWRGSGPGPGAYYDDSRDEGDYDPSRYYRADARYQERTLGPDERVYRGRDGRYYCRRNDGTTGLIVGAVAGGLFGNLIDGGRSRSVGTLLGAIIGGAAGQSIDRNNQQIRCR